MAFPPLHIVEPERAHSDTIILLHGRASNGAEFAEDLFDSKTSEGKNLKAQFPGCRWVFPTSRDRWSSVFKEDLTAWFDAYSLTNPCEQQDLQLDGLKESVSFILDVLRREIDLLGGKSEKVVLGGISQGMATGLWALLCLPGRAKGKIGGFFGMCGWLPFANKIQDLQPPKVDTAGKPEIMITKSLPDILGYKEPPASPAEIETMLTTPVLLLHGTDDAWIDVELGRRAHRSLKELGMQADWEEYSGADNEGHWVREPEGVDTIVKFLGGCLGGIEVN